ncbi:MULTISPECIES: Nif3-like dinuclear metal center hexameric protein [Methylotenera]|uniref:Nif3-like dinuclear metal center hexameric protein n=1 Tax=Methylotenera TaxID=359407 RepID=UPI00035FCFF6|nr:MULTISPECIES: Nif3-like dinuclear metal center hexameric protein [Methylotenera]
MKLSDLNNYLNQLLQPERFNDYCPNGLQVEGKSEVRHIVTGVTASYNLLEAAFEANADAILVHHGYFWRGESMPIIGIKKRRIQFLLKHDISLLAYHLPLDAHAEFGNNVMLAKKLGLTITNWAGQKHKNEPNLIALAELNQSLSLKKFVESLNLALNRPSQVIGDLERPIQKIALCTGAAQGYIEQAVEAGADVYISGEISEPTVHVAREAGIAYISAGHHATERYGVQALGEHLAQAFGLKHTFIDCDNPV